MKTHTDRFSTVLFKSNCLHINASKCLFAVDSVSYLGFRVDGEGIHKADDKINAIKNIKVPFFVTDLKSFLGLITFYGRFIPALYTLAASHL